MERSVIIGLVVISLFVDCFAVGGQNGPPPGHSPPPANTTSPGGFAYEMSVYGE